MSDSFSIAMVTSALYYLLDKEGITVSAQSPDSLTNADEQVNIFLYRVTPNLGYRNMDLPARGYDGNRVTKQQLGLDLHYLITAYSKKDKDDFAAHKLLGEVTRLLHENPIITRKTLEEMKDIGNLPPNLTSLATDIASSDLGEQVELIKLTLQNLSVEDVTKLWSSFFKTAAYKISVAYTATVVLIDGKHETGATMPVRKRNIYAIAPKHPEITYIDLQVIEHGTSTVSIVGRNLKADDVRIDFGEGKAVDDMPEPESVADDELVVDVSTLDIGVHQVRVVHALSIGTPEILHKGPESNAALFAIAPRFEHTADPADAAAFDSTTRKLTLKVEQGIKANQKKVEVIVGTQKPIEVEITSEPVTEIKVDVPQEIKDGTYPIRLRVDGAETQPDDFFENEYMRPVVEIF
jgi:Pvc16 N-terminal domain